jgi:serine/threonine protein kinase
MSSATPCPSAAAIRRFLGGAHAGAEADAVAEHLIGCDACREAAVALSSQPAVVEAIRAWSRRPTGATTAPEPETRAPAAKPSSPGASGLRSGFEVAEPRPSSGGTSSRADSAMTKLDDRCVLEPALEPDELGRLGPYRVLELLGEGGMGLVYRAIDTVLHRTIALKVMRPSVAQSAAARGRFEREARAIAALEHDHIVTIYQVGESNGLPYLAMPLLQGETLDKRLRAVQKLPVAEALRIARQIAEGLEAAHARGLVHRDIKPGNIWIESGKNRIKILDFGLAREAGVEDELTQTGVILGTPAYMAPEQAANDAVDARTDLFSLGSVLYRMLTGAAPFQGSNSLSVIRALAVAVPKPPHEVNPEIPIAVSRFVLRLLEKDPTRRPQQAGDVVKELAALEREVGGVAGASGSQAMSAIQRALLDEIGLADEGSDVQTPPPKPGGVVAKPSPSGSSSVRPAPGASGLAAASGVRSGQPGTSGVRAGSEPARPSASGGSQIGRSAKSSGVGPVPTPESSRSPRRAEVAPDRILRGIDTSFLDEESTVPATMLSETRSKRPRRPIPWPLLISLALLLFMATLALLIVLNRRG